jgi:hypothetical protein
MGCTVAGVPDTRKKRIREACGETREEFDADEQYEAVLRMLVPKKETLPLADQLVLRLKKKD